MDETLEKIDYFSNRNVNDGSYKNFLPPAYFLTILPQNKESRILDVGCGLGQFMEYLNTLGYKHVQGIDISDEAIRSCRRKKLHASKIEDIIGFHSPDNLKFDFVIMNHVIEHLPKDKIIRTLAFIKNDLLNEGGKLFIATPNAQALTGSYWRYEDFTHTTIFTSGSLFYVLKAAGFNEISIVDLDGLEGSKGIKKMIKKFFMKLLKGGIKAFFMFTGGAYHLPSPDVFTWEIKVIGG